MSYKSIAYIFFGDLSAVRLWDDFVQFGLLFDLANEHSITLGSRYYTHDIVALTDSTRVSSDDRLSLMLASRPWFLSFE